MEVIQTIPSAVAQEQAFSMLRTDATYLDRGYTQPCGLAVCVVVQSKGESLLLGPRVCRMLD